MRRRQKRFVQSDEKHARQAYTRKRTRTHTIRRRPSPVKLVSVSANCNREIFPHYDCDPLFPLATPLLGGEEEKRKKAPEKTRKKSEWKVQKETASGDEDKK